MTSAIIMALIGALLCTLFVNVHFIRQFFRGICLSRVKTPPDNKKDSQYDSAAETERTRFEFGFYGTAEAITFLIVQAIIFIIAFVILLCWYYFAAADRTISQFFISTGWLIGLIHFVNFLVLLMVDSEIELFEDWPKGFIPCALILSIGLFVLSCGCGIAESCYNYSHQEKTTTFLQDESVPVISVDTLKTLENEVLIDGYELVSAINRNGKVVIPMKRDGNVSYAGYVVIENDQPRIVQKSLCYTPAHSSTNNPTMIARENMPTKIFFGNWSFQLKPNENGEDDVYFVCAYGTFKWLRAGRNIEGMMFVNAETGEFSYCSIKDVPNWVSGISQ